MATKIKKVSVNELEKIVKESDISNTIEAKWNDVDVVIKPTLGLVDMMTFVYEVVNGCFIGENLEYTPELLDFYIRCEVLERYANFRLPKDVNKRYDLVYGCDAFRFVLERINIDQFEVVMNAINDKVDATVQANVSAINKQMGEIFATLNRLGGDVSRTLGEIDKDTFNKLASALAVGKFDEEKLVNALVEKKYGDGTVDTASPAGGDTDGN